MICMYIYIIYIYIYICISNIYIYIYVYIYGTLGLGHYGTFVFAPWGAPPLISFGRHFIHVIQYNVRIFFRGGLRRKIFEYF